MRLGRTKIMLGLLVAALFVMPVSGMTSATSADDEERSKWTVMLYIGADNEFYDNDVGDVVQFTLDQCAKAFDGADSDVSMVVLVDKLKTMGVEIYDDSDFVDRVDFWTEANTSDPATLLEFITYAQNNYPADNYALITKSGHAWCGICPDSDDDGSGLADTNEYWMMPIDGMASAIGGAPERIDMVVLDGDNMASIEALYELRLVVDDFVGSQQDVPLDGMPYQMMLGDLIEAPEMAPAEFASKIVEDYVLYYNNTEGKKVVYEHLLANSQMAVTASAFETGENGANVEEMVDSFMDIVSYMLYGATYDELSEDRSTVALTDWIPIHRPCIASARDFALIGKMADQAGYEWLPDVQSWIHMLQAYVGYDPLLYWGLGEDPIFWDLAMEFKAQFNESRVAMSQCQILDRSGNSDPNGLNFWFPQNWLHWDDINNVTRTRTYAYDGFGSWVDIPREYYCIDCPLNYSAVGLDFLSDYEAGIIAESPHTELWIQFYDIYYDAQWLLYNSDSGESKPMTGRS